MSSKIFKQKTLAGAVGFVLAFSLLSAPSAHANKDLVGEMSKMFGSMSNTTSPGVFETSRRGVISGGSLVIRNRVMNTSIVGFQPPSFSAGCGGIDMYGGSFSFINKEQFVQLMRSVASNALGYAFSLAIENMAPAVRAVMERIQEKIQEFNQYFGNSCQLAQGLVDNTRSAWNKKREVSGGLAKSIKDGAGDIFETMTGSSGKSPTEGLSEKEKEKIQGNVVWNALKNHKVHAWFAYGGDSLNMAIMSATGTYIVGEEEEAEDGMGKSAPQTPLQPTLTLTDLIKGGSVDLLVCDEATKCMNPKKENIKEFAGFEKMLLDTLLGNGKEVGILAKMRTGLALTPAEKAFIANLPTSAGAMIYRLSRVSEGVTRNFISTSAQPIAREMAYELVMAFMEATKIALSAEDGLIHAEKFLQDLERTHDRIMKEYGNLIEQGGSLPDLMSHYNSIMQAAEMMGVSPTFTPPLTPASSSGKN